jgi:hypothetical protein
MSKRRTSQPSRNWNVLPKLRLGEHPRTLSDGAGPVRGRREVHPRMVLVVSVQARRPKQLRVPAVGVRRQVRGHPRRTVLARMLVHQVDRERVHTHRWGRSVAGHMHLVRVRMSRVVLMSGVVSVVRLTGMMLVLMGRAVPERMARMVLVRVGVRRHHGVHRRQRRRRLARVSAYTSHSANAHRDRDREHPRVDGLWRRLHGRDDAHRSCLARVSRRGLERLGLHERLSLTLRLDGSLSLAGSGNGR